MKSKASTNNISENEVEFTAHFTFENQEEGETIRLLLSVFQQRVEHIQLVADNIDMEQQLALKKQNITKLKGFKA